MKLRELAVIAGAAVSMFACRGQDDDARPDVSLPVADSTLDSARSTADSASTDTPTANPRPPARSVSPDSARRDTNAGAPPGRNPPIGDPAPIERPPVKLPRGDST